MTRPKCFERIIFAGGIMIRVKMGIISITSVIIYANQKRCDLQSKSTRILKIPHIMQAKPGINDIVGSLPIK